MQRYAALKDDEEDEDEDEEDEDDTNDEPEEDDRLENAANNVKVFCVSSLEFRKMRNKGTMDGPSQVSMLIVPCFI